MQIDTCDPKRDPEKKWDLASWIRVIWVLLSPWTIENIDLTNSLYDVTCEVSKPCKCKPYSVPALMQYNFILNKGYFSCRQGFVLDLMKYRLSSYWTETLLPFPAPPYSTLMSIFLATLRKRGHGASLDLLDLIEFFYSKSLSDKSWWMEGIEEGWSVDPPHTHTILLNAGLVSIHMTRAQTRLDVTLLCSVASELSCFTCYWAMNSLQAGAYVIHISGTKSSTLTSPLVGIRKAVCWIEQNQSKLDCTIQNNLL